MAALFVAGAHILGLVLAFVPRLLHKSPMCYETSSPTYDDSVPRAVIKDWIYIAGSLMVAYQVAFMVLEKVLRTNNQLWIYIKTFNFIFQLQVAGCLIVFIFPFSLLTSLFILPLLNNTVPPMAKGQSFEFIKGTLLNVAVVAGAAFLLFGTIFAEQTKAGEANWGTVAENLVLASLMDFECVGQALWLYLCCTVLPNLLVIVKIFIN